MSDYTDSTHILHNLKTEPTVVLMEDTETDPPDQTDTADPNLQMVCTYDEEGEVKLTFEPMTGAEAGTSTAGMIHNNT